MATHILAEAIELLENTLNTESKTVDVVLIRPGWSANGRYYSRKVLAEAAQKFEGVKAYANHPTRAQLKAGEGRSVLDITGDYTNVHIGESGELRATRHVYGKAGEAVWPLIERAVETRRPIIGVSINALGKASKGKTEDGREGVIVESIEVANSADDVDTPAAGGKFENLLMGSDNTLVSDLLQAITEEELTEARPDLVESMRKQMKRARQDETVRALTEERNAAKTALETAQADRDAAVTQANALRAETARLRAQVALEQGLREANFKPKFEALLRERLETTDPTQWIAIVADEKEKIKALDLKPDPVPVHGASLRESAPIHPPAHFATPVVDMAVYDTPEKLAAYMQTMRK